MGDSRVADNDCMEKYKKHWQIASASWWNYTAREYAVDTAVSLYVSVCNGPCNTDGCISHGDENGKSDSAAS